MARDKKFRKGPSSNAVGWTHASVSAIKSPGLEPKAGRVSAIPNIKETSIMCISEPDLCNGTADGEVAKALT